MEHLSTTDKNKYDKYDQILATMRKFNHFMAPRLGNPPFRNVAAAVKEVLHGIGGVAIFICDDEESPTLLRLEGSAGYKSTVGDVTYVVERKSFTTDVFESGEVRNLSAKELEEESGSSLARCSTFYDDGGFYNVAAIPIEFEGGRFGVLKIENDGAIREERVRAEYVGEGRIIAHLIAIEYQRRRYADLWAQSAKRKGEDGGDYFKRLPGILRNMFHTKVAVFYSRSPGSKKLKWEGGAGLISESPMSDCDLGTDSVVAYAAGNTELCVRLKSEAVEKRIVNVDRRDPFLWELRQALSKSPDRSRPESLLVAPVVRDGQNCGVFVLADKRRGDFTTDDELVALEFASHISFDVLSLVSGRTKSSTGLEELEKIFGRSVRLKGRALRLKVHEVQEARDKSQGKVTGEDCAKFMQISRPYFLRLAKARL